MTKETYTVGNFVKFTVDGVEYKGRISGTFKGECRVYCTDRVYRDVLASSLTLLPKKAT